MRYTQNETVDVPSKYFLFGLIFFLLLRVDLSIIIVLIVFNEWYPRVNLSFQIGPHKKKEVKFTWS